jgi:hypothetical protein
LHPGAGQVSVTIPLGMVSSPFHRLVVGVKIPCHSVSDDFNLHSATLRCNTSNIPKS